MIYICIYCRYNFQDAGKNTKISSTVTKKAVKYCRYKMTVNIKVTCIFKKFNLVKVKHTVNNTVHKASDIANRTCEVILAPNRQRTRVVKYFKSAVPYSFNL